MTLYEYLRAEDASWPEQPDGWAYTALPAVLALIDAARNVSGLACGAWPELAAALAPFSEER